MNEYIEANRKSWSVSARDHYEVFRELGLP